jgi:hypothetical protein
MLGHHDYQTRFSTQNGEAPVHDPDPKPVRPTPTADDYAFAANLVYRVCNLPFKNVGEANDHVAQLLANRRAGYVEPIPRPVFSKPT